ncbi:Bicyclomycin resistance protein [Candidatus Rhodobacter oscarellae]|uniref:Bcr/CflA family efflux transporter n=1 Tax=Candidatus Rhodobacter oscarellae TaxID=1675527 RepID=A0A0J9H3T5_9RHOB|nr:Bcr/CflA family efflux MFS transporter [Candidatus Rhodobacter lobularis]KMW60343.1 Bicyclomycin resistance protein [Candidatus Rhodobacter lobularis]
MFSAASSPPRLSTLILLTALSVLSLNMFLPSLANIAAEFEVSYALASLSVSGFLAINAVLQLALGPMSDRLGRRPVILSAVGLFVVASLVAAVAPSIWVFLAARVVQAGIIAGSVVASAVVTDLYKRDEAARRMSLIAMAMAVAPMLAPMLGGALDELYGWRSGFWLYTAMGAGMLWLVWADLGETAPMTGAGSDPLKGLPELVRSRRLWAYSTVMAAGIGAFFLFISAAPLVGQKVFGLSTSMIGFAIGIITAGFFVGTFLSGRYAARIGVVRFVVWGRWATVLGLAASLVLFLSGWAHPAVFFAGAVAAGFGNGLSIPNARAAALAVKPELAGSASGLSGAFATGAGAVLTALPGLVLTESNAAWLTLALMLGLGLIALGAAIYAQLIDARMAEQGAT